MSNYNKIKWYRFRIARRIRNLEGEELLAELEDIIEDIYNKKLDKIGFFKLQIRELERMIAEIKEKPKKKARQYDPFYIPISGDGRIALFGLSNAGKSTLMNAITNAEVKTGAYLHTTRVAHAGTLEYENLKIQIVDIPGFLEFKDDWAINRQIVRVARTCDAIMLVIDLSLEIEKQYSFLIGQLKEANIIGNGDSLYKIGVIATKGDLPDSAARFDKLKELTDFQICPISIKYKNTLENVKAFLFNQLEIVRIYTKKPGEKADLYQPFVCPIGTTIKEVAEKIHTSFIPRFRYARIWGESADFEGQKVGLEHEVRDSDIVELVLTR